MASDFDEFFKVNFCELTGRMPYVWQRKLYAQMAGGAADWPEVVDLPTGSGKTSILYVWLLALAWSVRCGRFDVPRRLAWIVNRRVVVDQVTSDVERLVSTEQGLARCPEVRDLLASISMSHTPLAVSTLRGQYADNGAWSRDPSTPAVVVGTVDMIGSRLLFRGYRSGRYHRPIHAGLLGVDTLVVNDEAHLSPAFVQLLDAIRTRQPASEIPGKTFRILLLSATASKLPELRKFDHDPVEDAAESPAFEGVFRAPKTLTLLEVDPKSFESLFWSTATETPSPRTIVFIEQPEKAVQFAERLNREGLRCRLLTGTMRGRERDNLLSDPIFQRFLDRDPLEEPVWLVSTSAGEVGVNLSCERMVTDLCEADHLLQRFGRLNRFGGKVAGEAFVVYRPPKDQVMTGSLEYLRSLDGNIACSQVWDRRPPVTACSKLPALARLESRHIDIWSQTTFKDRFVPQVASWLHGQQDSIAPETEVAWRADVRQLTEWELGEGEIQRVLEYYPVLVRERLREPSSRVAKKLAEIADRIGSAETRKTKLIVVEMDGSPTVHTFEIILDRLARNEAFLDNVLLLLPDHLGSLRLGMFRGTESSADEGTMDVADEAASPVAERVRVRFTAESDGTLRPLVGAGGLATVPASTSRDDLAEFAEQHRYRPAVVVRHPEDENKAVVYFGALSQFARSTPRNIFLTDHQDHVSETATLVAEKLHLGAFGTTFADCGRVHDSGKRRPVWQRAMGGSMDKPLAKTKAAVNVALLNGYRHEFGSLLDALKDAAHRDNDLLLHLVASHHAGARPYFEQRQYDRMDLASSARECAEATRRYARLQARYGAWGLAYLEAVFKCTDGLISALEGEPASA